MWDHCVPTNMASSWGGKHTRCIFSTTTQFAKGFMLNAHLPTGSRQLAISPTGDSKSALVGRCVPNADPIVAANRRYSADSKFESALEPVGASR